MIREFAHFHPNVRRMIEYVLLGDLYVDTLTASLGKLQKSPDGLSSLTILSQAGLEARSFLLVTPRILYVHPLTNKTH